MRYLHNYVIMKFASQSDAVGGVAGKRCLGSLACCEPYCTLHFSPHPRLSGSPCSRLLACSFGCLLGSSAACWVLQESLAVCMFLHLLAGVRGCLPAHRLPAPPPPTGSSTTSHGPVACRC